MNDKTKFCTSYERVVALLMLFIVIFIDWRTTQGEWFVIKILPCLASIIDIQGWGIISCLEISLKFRWAEKNFRSRVPLIILVINPYKQLTMWFCKLKKNKSWISASLIFMTNNFLDVSMMQLNDPKK